MLYYNIIDALAVAKIAILCFNRTANVNSQNINTFLKHNIFFGQYSKYSYLLNQ